MDIRIVLSIEYNMYRSCLKKVLEEYDDVYVIGETSFFDEVENILNENSCDIIITDMHMKNMLFKDVINNILPDNKAGVIILTSSDNLENIQVIPEIENYAVVSLISDFDKLIKAIHTVNNKQKYIDEKFEKQYSKECNEKISLLTNREREVIKLIAQGFFNKEIASKMGITERTVKNHVSNIFKKIDVSDRTQAAIYAIRNNIVNL